MGGLVQGTDTPARAPANKHARMPPKLFPPPSYSLRAPHPFPHTSVVLDDEEAPGRAGRGADRLKDLPETHCRTSWT